MSETLTLIIAGVVLIVLVFQLSKAMDEHKRMVSGQLENLSDQMEQLKDTLNQLKDKLNEIHYNTLPLPEKEELAFENARPFSLSDVRHLKPGDRLRLISQSYFYPNDEPHIDRFEYKHHHLDESDRTQFGYRVHGFWRSSALEEWMPYDFFAKDDECTTSGCDGTIKRLL